MSSVQQLLVLGASMVLTYLIFNYFRSTSYQNDVSLFNEAVISATGIGQSIIDEIQTKAFDEQTVLFPQDDASGLTAAADLGPDPGETSYTLFNDIDDYNEYSRVDSLDKLGNFYTSVEVYYVNSASPNLKTTVKNFTKRVDVFVTTFLLMDTLKLSQIISY